MNDGIRRRRFVQTVAVGVGAGLSGCIGDDEPEDSDDGADGDDDHEQDHDEHVEDEAEDEAPGSEGLVYAFAPDRAVLIDPDEGEIVEDLSDEVDEDLEDADWGDARLTRDENYLFVVEASGNRVGVIDTERRELVDWIGVGAGATHAYSPVEGEIWVHADGEGRLYVIDTDELEVKEVVQSGLDDGGHGKLLTHDDLHPLAYSTNTDDSYGHVIDLEEYERVDSISVGDSGGTHYVMYGPENDLVYFERSGADDIPYFDADTYEEVGRLEVNGGLAITPNHEMIGVWEDDAVHFVDATTRESEILGTVDLEGRGPDDLDFFEEDGTLYAFTANTTSSEVSVVNVDEFEVETHIEAGSIVEEGPHLHRSGVLGGGYYFTTSGADGTVPVIDVGERELVHEVEVAEEVDTLAYVGAGSGAWY